MWKRLLQLEQEFTRRGVQISRSKISDAFQISERTARTMQHMLQYRDIISMQPERDSVEEGTKLFVMADIHFPFQDKLALATAIDEAEEYQPNIILLLGDTIDFYKLSRYIQNPKERNTTAEINMCKDFLVDLRLRFPSARIIYYVGNHEERLDNYIMSKANEIYDLVEGLLELKLGLAELKMEYITEPFSIGKLWCLHGHEKPGGSYNPEYVCNIIWKCVHDHFLCAHFHRTQEKVFPSISGKKYWGGSCGYLAGYMSYARLNQWNQGFCKIEFHRDGTFKANNCKIIEGHLY